MNLFLASQLALVSLLNVRQCQDLLIICLVIRSDARLLDDVTGCIVATTYTFIQWLFLHILCKETYKNKIRFKKIDFKIYKRHEHNTYSKDNIIQAVNKYS